MLYLKKINAEPTEGSALSERINQPISTPVSRLTKRMRKKIEDVDVIMMKIMNHQINLSNV